MSGTKVAADAKEIVGSLEQQFNKQREQQRPAAWEAGLRRWRVLRHVKLHREAQRRGDADAAQQHANAYKTAVEKVERLMKIDPLRTAGGGGAEAARVGGDLQFHLRDSEGGGEFKWRDQDYVAGEEAFVPQLDVSLLRSGAAPLETSGDRRKKEVVSKQLASQRAAEARREKRQREVDEIAQKGTSAEGTGDAPKAEAINHNWDSYQSALERQQDDVKRRATLVSKMKGSAADKYGDVLGNSDED